MKATLLLLLPFASAALLTTSCTQNQGAVDAPVAPPANTGNAYGVPGQPAPGGYVQEAAPYQPVNPINPPAIPAPPTVPNYTPPPATTTSGGTTHNIQKGDSLWGLSRRYGVSIDAIRQANNLSGDTIITGQPLIIPGR